MLAATFVPASGVAVSKPPSEELIMTASLRGSAKLPVGNERLHETFGELLVELGFVTEYQVQEALALQSLTGNRVGEALMSLATSPAHSCSGAVDGARARPADRARQASAGEVLLGLKYVEMKDIDAASSSSAKTAAPR